MGLTTGVMFPRSQVGTGSTAQEQDWSQVGAQTDRAYECSPERSNMVKATREQACPLTGLLTRRRVAFPLSACGLSFVK